MLKFAARYFYHGKIYTSEKNLFYDFYKWTVGLDTLLNMREIIYACFFCLLGIAYMALSRHAYIGYVLFDIGVIILLLNTFDKEDIQILHQLGAKSKSECRSAKISEFIRKFVSLNGKALGLKEWRKIKKENVVLYKNLLSNECWRQCYYYSLEIAKIIKDCTLLWGGIKDPFESSSVFYAHAVILRNGYVYDTNFRQSVKYEDFKKLYQFKIYKMWDYEKYSENNFRNSERKEFQAWCKENNVTFYNKF